MPNQDSEPTDHDLDVASSQYVNPELARYDMNSDYFQFRLDTWYYQEGEEVGRMQLGEGPLTVADGILEFVTTQLHAVQRGLASLLHPQAIHLNYQPSLDRPPMHTLFLGFDDLIAAPSRRFAELAGFPHFVVSFSVRCAARVVLRDNAGDLRDAWLPDAGEVRFFAEWSKRYTPQRPPDVTHTSSVPPARVPWVASLHLNILSLFRPDNAERLAMVREAWKQLHAEDPGATAFSGYSDDYYIVTLAEPPAGTPADNLELHILNALRLREAISHWEQITGRKFEWTVPQPLPTMRH